MLRSLSPPISRTISTVSRSTYRPITCPIPIRHTTTSTSTAQAPPASASPPSDPYPIFPPPSSYADSHRHHHIPLSLSQRLFLTTGASLLGIVNTHRADMIATLGETTAIDPILQNIRNTMLSNEEGKWIIDNKPRINTSTISLLYFSSLPPNTLGYSYYHFLTSHTYTPDTRTPVRFIDDIENAYIMTRYREIHDIAHVLTGLPTTVMGEIVQKWFEFGQTGLPMCLLSGLFGPVRLTFRQQSALVTTYIPWALSASKSCYPLMSVAFERYWEYDVDELRKKWNFRVPPTLTE